MTWGWTIFALIFVAYHVNFVKGNDIGTSIKERDTSNDTYVCRSDCTIVSRVYDSINSSADPCNDFYDFACGHIQESLYSIDSRQINMELIVMITNRMFPDESREMELVRKLYKSCKNRTEIESVGMEPFNEIIRKIGGWPLMEGVKWNEAAFDWIESIRKMRDIGLVPNHLFSASVETNFKNSSIRSLMVKQPDFSTYFSSLQNLFQNETVLYQKHHMNMVNLIAAYGAHMDSYVLQEITDLLVFERALINISLPIEELRDYEAQFNPFKISEMQIKYPYIQWMDYFDAFLPADVQITPDEVVIVRTPKYFDRFAEVLQRTSNRTIANFFALRTLSESLKYLKNPSLEQANSFVNSIGSGRFDCVKITTELLAPAIGALYIRKFPKDENLKENVENLVESIRNSFIDMLNNATWMDEDTKNVAVEKAKSMKAYIGFLKELLNQTKLEEHYKSLTLTHNEFFMNVLRLRKFNLDYSFRQLHESVDKDNWRTYTMLAPVGASYVTQKNTILISKMILRGALISTDRPNYMNYGALGQVIGHEIAHGFDDVSRKMDKNGNLKDWWMPETKLEYLDKIKCIIDQYGNFTEPITEINVNGKLTVGENIADNIGFKSAYYAYTKWLENNHDIPLPELMQYTSKQMFWISAAQKWCSWKDDGEDIIISLVSDVHSPNRFRVNGPMRNSKEFAIDFKCAPGTPMNPIEKCELW